MVICVVLFSLMEFDTVENITYEQSSFDYFVTEIYPREFLKKPKIRYEGKVSETYSTFLSMCFPDYLRIINDSLGVAEQTSDKFRTTAGQNTGGELSTKGTKFCRDNSKKWNKQRFLLEIRKADSVKEGFCFVEIIVRTPSGVDHFYVELTSSKDVIRWCKVSETR